MSKRLPGRWDQRLQIQTSSWHLNIVVVVVVSIADSTSPLVQMRRPSIRRDSQHLFSSTPGHVMPVKGKVARTAPGRIPYPSTEEYL